MSVIEVQILIGSVHAAQTVIGIGAGIIHSQLVAPPDMTSANRPVGRGPVGGERPVAGSAIDRTRLLEGISQLRW